jgi:hypothetical protein
MILLFGTKTKPEKKGAINFYCPQCYMETAASIIEVTKYFTFFFIPIFPYDDKLYMQCNICGVGGEIKEEFREKMIESTKKMVVQ